MPIVLWLLGLVTTVAGLLLVASAFGLRDGTFDSEVLTPGMVGVVGGLLLIGLGIAVREMRRIERALAARSMLRPEKVAQPIAAESVDVTPAVAVAASNAEPKPDAVPEAASVAIAEDEALERLRAKFPTLVRRSNGASAPAANAPAPQVRVDVEEAIAVEVKGVTAAMAHAANGRMQPTRLAPRLKVQAAAAAKTNGSVLSAFWPANPRRDDKTVSPSSAVSDPPQPAAVVDAETSSASKSAVHEMPAEIAKTDTQPGVTPPVKVLKSGVVEGMAYTLFSDGSIEADLPQGTLRFGSIGALREHIEGTAH